MEDKFRGTCPIATALDIVGDKWSLIIIRDMLTLGKQTFKEFSNSQEAIASNILSSRLKKLEEFNLITKEKLEGNKKANFYKLTSKGLSLTPLIVELTIWSYDNIQEFNTHLVLAAPIEEMKENKEVFIQAIQDSYIEKII